MCTPHAMQMDMPTADARMACGLPSVAHKQSSLLALNSALEDQVNWQAKKGLLKFRNSTSQKMVIGANSIADKPINRCSRSGVFRPRIVAQQVRTHAASGADIGFQDDGIGLSALTDASRPSKLMEFLTSERAKVVVMMALGLSLCNANRIVMSVAIVPLTATHGWSSSFAGIVQQASGPSEHLGGLSNEVSAGFLSGGSGEASFEADKTGDRAMGLTPAEDTGEAVVSKVIRADKRHFFFDLGCNNRGQFLRISEVIGSDRSAIIVPVSALEQFHDVLGHFVDITRTQGLAAASGANVCTVAAAHRRNEN